MYLPKLQDAAPCKGLAVFCAPRTCVAPVLQAYKNYISFILNRTNTITGMQYKNDPIIFALELANEPHTSDNYEINLGLQPGSIVLAWVYEISAYIKGISPNHMVRCAAAPCMQWLQMASGMHVDDKRPARAPHDCWGARATCRSPLARRATACPASR